MKSLYYKLGRLIIKEHMKQYINYFTYKYNRSIYKKQEENKIFFEILNFFFGKILIKLDLYKKIKNLIISYQWIYILTTINTIIIVKISKILFTVKM